MNTSPEVIDLLRKRKETKALAIAILLRNRYTANSWYGLGGPDALPWADPPDGRGAEMRATFRKLREAAEEAAGYFRADEYVTMMFELAFTCRDAGPNSHIPGSSTTLPQDD